jgi:hypothetical protein
VRRRAQDCAYSLHGICFVLSCTTSTWNVSDFTALLASDSAARIFFRGPEAAKVVPDKLIEYQIEIKELLYMI